MNRDDMQTLQDMQTLAEWYLKTKSLDLTPKEHLDIMELFGFERQESSDEFNLDESDYVMDVMVKFNDWFGKRWEFLNRYFELAKTVKMLF